MIKNPIAWLRSQGFGPNDPLPTNKVLHTKDGKPFHLTGGSAIRLWPSQEITRPINANVTISIRGIREGADIRIEPVNCRVQISGLVATKILQQITAVGQFDPYLKGLGIEHFSLHGSLRVPRTTSDNTKLVLADLDRSEMVPNLWFQTTQNIQSELLVQSSSGSITMQQVIAANRTLTYRGKKIANVPLRTQKGHILFLGKKYSFSTFMEEVLRELSQKELMTPEGTIAIPKMDARNELVYRRALHYLCTQVAEYNTAQFTEPMPTRMEPIFEVE